jgi:hypothetical protein
MDRRSFLASGAALAAVASASRALAASGNPLLEKWVGAYDGLPPFDKVRLPDFEPAFRAAMDMQRAEIAAITGSKAAPTFANTVEALERSGEALNNVSTLYYVHTSVLITPQMQAIEERMAPVLAAYGDELTQNSLLFARIKTVYAARETSGLTAEQQRLVWVYHNNFVQSGAALDAPGKARLAAINLRLADLYTGFSKNLLADERSDVLVIDKVEDLAGVPQANIGQAAAEAERRGLRGKWVIANNSSGMNPVFTFASRRDIRKKAWDLRMGLGGHAGGPTDNAPIIKEILKLRYERSRLLGYDTFAHWRVSDRMAGTPQNAITLMEALLKPAIARMGEEVADMKAIAAAEGAAAQGADKDFGPWDYRYYGEKVRKGEIRHRRGRAAALPPARQDEGGDVLGRRPGLRPDLRAGLRRADPASRCRGLGGQGPRRQAPGAVALRSLRPGGQAVRRLGQHPALAGPVPEDHHGDLDQPVQLLQAGGRAADPAQLGRRRRFAVPRVRPRHPSHVLGRDLSDPVGRQRDLGLRRVSQPDLRALGDDARGAGQVRRPPRDR